MRASPQSRCGPRDVASHDHFSQKIGKSKHAILLLRGLVLTGGTPHNGGPRAVDRSLPLMRAPRGSPASLNLGFDEVRGWAAAGVRHAKVCSVEAQSGGTQWP
jgi:hypothetical protein